ncbi:MAG: hypothetical protein IEMM0002_0811 [bacterium]|nr:MAG: hypothetical protein IEMM0002_0811 [bacterium]
MIDLKRRLMCKKKLILIHAAVVLFVFSTYVSVYGAEEFVCYYKEMEYAEDFLIKGAEAEKNGDLFRTFLYYQGASECIRSAAHKKEVKRVVELLAADARNKGNVYSEGAYKTIFDDNCPSYGEETWGTTNVWFPADVDVSCKTDEKKVRIELKDSVGAFDIYEAARYHAEADLAMMNWIRSAPENMEVFATAYRHFNNRRKGLRGSDKSLSGYEGDKLLGGYTKELKKISVENARRILKKEEKIFNKNKVKTAVESIMLIGLARKWFSYMAGEMETKIVKRSKKRGDILFRNRKEPLALKRASEYYGMARMPKENIEVRERANELGEMYASQKRWKKAAEYFTISGNRPRLREAEKFLKK